MLKKHNKLIMLLVLVTFMFTMVGSAGAATFSDVKGTSVEASAIYKLNGLGIIDGYPDGTFGPEKTITRAEFAKIACITAGLKAVASGMGGTVSPFSDVATDHWANGWINVAAAQGFVKGDPAGTFRPADQITQAEVVTVLLRLLGYNDNLPGNWPSDYIAKAANLGILDDVTFMANQAATRGTVAILAGATLDENTVEYLASDNVFPDVVVGAGLAAKNVTLLEAKFKNSLSTTGVLVKEVTKTDGVYTMTIDGNTCDPIVADYDVELLSDAVVSGAEKLSLTSKFVDYTVDKDGKATYVGIKDAKEYPVVITKKLEITETQAKVKTKEGKTYSFISNWANVYKRNLNLGTDAALVAGAVGTYENADMYSLTLNKDGKVVMIMGASLPQGGIVDSVGKDKIFFKDNASPMVVAAPLSQGTSISYTAASNFTDKDIIVQKDGKECALSDLKEGDAVWVVSNASATFPAPLGTLVASGNLGADYNIMAFTTQVPAKLSTVELGAGNGVSKIITDKGDFKTVAGYPLLSVDGGKKFEAGFLNDTQVNKYDLFDTDVTLLLSGTGKVAAVISNAKASDSNIYGMVTKVAGTSVYVNNKEAYLVTVLRADGEKYDYPVYVDSKVDGVKIGALPASIPAANSLIGVELDSNGMVKNIVTAGLNTASGAVTVNTDLDAIKLNSTGKYYSAKDIVIYNINTAAGTGPVVVKWTEYKDTPAVMSGYYVDGTVIEYAVIDAAVGSSAKYAVVMGKGINKDGDYVKLLTGADTETFEVTNVAGVTAKGTIAEYTLSGGKATMNVLAETGTGVNVTKMDIANKIIEINNVGYLFDADTLFFDTYDTDAPKAITVNDIARGEKVSFKVDAKNVLLYVTIVK